MANGEDAVRGIPARQATEQARAHEAAVGEVIGALVAAVRAGDDAAVRVLLDRLAAIADLPALLDLREALRRDLVGGRAG